MWVCVSIKKSSNAIVRLCESGNVMIINTLRWLLYNLKLKLKSEGKNLWHMPSHCHILLLLCFLLCMCVFPKCSRASRFWFITDQRITQARSRMHNTDEIITIKFCFFSSFWCEFGKGSFVTFEICLKTHKSLINKSPGSWYDGGDDVFAFRLFYIDKLCTNIKKPWQIKKTNFVRPVNTCSWNENEKKRAKTVNSAKKANQTKPTKKEKTHIPNFMGKELFSKTTLWIENACVWVRTRSRVSRVSLFVCKIFLLFFFFKTQAWFESWRTHAHTHQFQYQ